MAKARRRRSRDDDASTETKKGPLKKKAASRSERIPKQRPRSDDASTEIKKSPLKKKAASRSERIPKQKGSKPSKNTPSSRGGRKAKGSKPSRQRLTQEDREQIELDKDRKTTKMVIIISSIIVFLLVGTISAQILMRNAAYNKILQINLGEDKLFSDYMSHPAVREMAGYGSAGVTKILDGLDEQISNNGSESLKKNLIAALAASFKKDRSLSDSNIAIEKLKKFIEVGEGDTKVFAINSLAFIPSGINELGNIVKSEKVDANTSWLAFNSLLKSKDKIPGDVLVMALKKQDDAFVSKVLPVIAKNISEFSKEPDALKYLFKTIKNSNEENATIATGLLSSCTTSAKHYQIIKNNCTSKNKRTRKAALDALLEAPAISGGRHWADLAETSQDEEILLRVIPKLGDEDCQEFHIQLLPKLESADIKVVEAAILAIGKMNNSPSKGLKKIIAFLKHDNTTLKNAAIKSVAGFRYLAPYKYAKTPEAIPAFVLVKLLNSKDATVVKAVMASLKKITKKSFSSANGWQEWWAKEKAALELIILMESTYKKVEIFIKPRKWKKAKVEIEKVIKLYDTLENDYINRWKGFSTFLSNKRLKYNQKRGLINKMKGI